jgi:hypothetical protein
MDSKLCLADFLGSLITCLSALPERIAVLSGSHRTVDLPAELYCYTLQPPVPSEGRTVTPASPHRP